MADINRTELVDAIAQESGHPKNVVSEVLHSLEGVVKATVANGDKVTIPGFIKFERTERAARTGRNPQTGEALAIPASKSVKVAAGSRLKDAVR